MRKKECVAMLLAGGQGSRLYVLTTDVAKPAVPFGGKFRIIDFPLSNCANSNIDTVGVLTQYQPHALNAYIGSGLPWDLDRLEGGVRVLPPYVKSKGGTWYKGTANAICQNIGFIETYDPEYVLVLSGDHIYKMDYRRMIAQHKKTGADCTVAVIEVPLSEASRFGILSTGEDGRVVSFEEKPKKPQSGLASMGVYVFSWRRLKAYLLADEADISSKNDFGGNIIPAMLAAGEKMFSYRFKGYWKDVGTIDSLWEANMDLLAGSKLDLFDPAWRIYARAGGSPPHFVGPAARVSHSLVTEGCEIYGSVENSVLFTGVTVGAGARVKYAIVMPGATIAEDAVVEYAIIAEDAVVGPRARVGADPSAVSPKNWGVAVVGPSVTVGAGVTLAPRGMADADMLAGDDAEGGGDRVNDMHGLIFAYAKGGENLKELTERRAVPSLPFGGRYRVIDFMLSNMVNAGVTDVGVVMRENYQSLLDHLESGKNWDLSRKRGGLRLLPPFSYAGTGPYEGVFLGNMAALYNISAYLSHTRQDYVVVAEGGLVANLPLEDALRRHVDTGADITVLCTPHRLGQQEFSSFLTLGAAGRVADIARGRDMDGAFEMLGVYILSKPLLLSLVTHCAAHNLYDFERDVLQNMMGSLGLFGYVFDGYAARMTTVPAYFKHNMDMLRGEVRASLFLKDRPIKTKVRDEASAYYGPDARVRNCIVADGCYIEGDVENSVISRGVRIEAGVRVHNSLLLQDTRISTGAILGYVITDKEVVVGPGRMLMGHATYPIAVSKGSVV